MALNINIPKEILIRLLDLLNQGLFAEAERLAAESNIAKTTFDDLSTIHFWGWHE